MSQTAIGLESGRPSSKVLARLVGASSPLGVKRALWGYAFLLPWLVGLIVFWLGPILASAAFSLTEYDVISPPKFVGLQNYATAFTSDEQFWPSVARTFQFTFISVPLNLAGSLLLAILLNRGFKGTNVFRTLVYLPSLVPAVALAVIWMWMLHPTLGPMNLFLDLFGVEGPGWLTTTEWALPSIIMMDFWATWGGNSMLIFLAGLQGVPQSLMDAAEIDGAGRWAKFRHVTLPMVSPTLLFNFILGVIGALKVFTLSFVATKGGPSYATWFFALHIYNQGFEYFRMGYASALAWIFVLILLVFTFVQIKLSQRWVYYAGE